MNAPIRNGARRPRTKRGPQRRPTGPYFPVDAAWKADIRRCLDRRGWSQAELARKIGASPGSIVLIFKPKAIQSRLVPAIHQALDLDPPGTTKAA